MQKESKIKINQDFFKTWSSDMAYILGFVVADGSIIKRRNGINSYIFDITSKDKNILQKIKYILKSEHTIGIKYNSLKMSYNHLTICNREICEDLMGLGICPRKTYNLEPIKVPETYFADYVRGFFDRDGTVYIYDVNKSPQIKSGFVAARSTFIKDFNKRLCKALKISEKSVHQMKDKRENTMVQYSVCFYIDDSEKLAKFMYHDNPTLYLNRKKEIFDQWKLIKRRHYTKQNYPSKIGWHLNEKILN